MTGRWGGSMSLSSQKHDHRECEYLTAILLSSRGENPKPLEQTIIIKKGDGDGEINSPKPPTKSADPLSSSERQ